MNPAGETLANRTVERAGMNPWPPSTGARAGRSTPLRAVHAVHIDEKVRLWSSAAGEVVYGDRS